MSYGFCSKFCTLSSGANTLKIGLRFGKVTHSLMVGTFLRQCSIIIIINGSVVKTVDSQPGQKETDPGYCQCRERHKSKITPLCHKSPALQTGSSEPLNGEDTTITGTVIKV